MPSSGKRWARVGGPLIAAALLVVLTGVGSASAATLVSDNFEDANASGWTTTGGTWIVNLDGTNHVLRQSSLVSGALARTGNLSWRNYTVSAAVKPESFNGLPGYTGVVARAASTTNYYAAVLRADGTLAVTRTVNGTTLTLASAKVSVDLDTWYTVSLAVSGTRLTGSVGGTSVSATDGFLYQGPAGLTTTWSVTSFDNVAVTN